MSDLIVPKDSAVRLHAYILKHHWREKAVRGPDPGIRFNARIGRFVKGYLSWCPWKDNYAYTQAQKYWILNNWLMADLELGDTQQLRQIAVDCSDYLVRAQVEEGYWEYPNPEWKGRVATVEGNYASIGLLETFARTQDERYLDAAANWYDFVLKGVGFTKSNGFMAPNYFAQKPGGMVPNITTSLLHALARLWKLTHDDRFMEYQTSFVEWLNHVQLESGELPYAVSASPGLADRIHFLCYQYNAFEFLNLAEYHEITEDDEICPVLERLGPYLANGVLPTGAARYSCSKDSPDVTYFGAALAAALDRATMMGIDDYGDLSERGYRRVLSQQQADGGISHYSRRNYGILSDRRSYPRYLCMILYHLLLKIKSSSDCLHTV